jgi:hypothetical protein
MAYPLLGRSETIADRRTGAASDGRVRLISLERLAKEAQAKFISSFGTGWIACAKAFIPLAKGIAVKVHL